MSKNWLPFQLPFLLSFLTGIFLSFNVLSEPKTTESKETEMTDEATVTAGAPKSTKKKKGLIQEMSGQGYGMSGCGLGSILFGQDNSTGIQIFSATTNYTAANQTFAIVSGTSNCSPYDGTDVSDAALMNTLKYVEANFTSLKNDVAKNQGQTLAGLSGVLGCTSNQELGSWLQSNYEVIYPSNNKNALENEATYAGKAIFRLVESNNNLKNNCQI